MPGELIPIVAIVSTFGVPLVWLLLHHQRKMAELIHGSQAQQNLVDPAVQDELRALRHLINQQTIAIDNINSRLNGSLPKGEDVLQLKARLDGENV